VKEGVVFVYRTRDPLYVCFVPKAYHPHYRSCKSRFIPLQYIQLSKSPVHDPYTLLYYHLFVASTLYIFTMSSSAYPSNGQLSTSPQEYDMDSNFTVSTYARTMFQHTQKQMDAATRSAKRRRASEKNGVNAHGTLDTQGSVSSMDSNRSA